MRKKEIGVAGKAAQLREGKNHPFGALAEVTALGGHEAELYKTMRRALPVLDSAVSKLVRLVGGFEVKTSDPAATRGLRAFLRTVPVGYAQRGIRAFLNAYVDSLLTYGKAVGEMVVWEGELAAVCWGDVTKIHVQPGTSPLEFQLGVYEAGQMKLLPRQDLLLFSTRNPEPGSEYGVSIFRSMPFLTDVLLKIYKTIGVNWERAGNVRYSVVYRPQEGAEDPAAAEQMAKEWSAAMQDNRSGAVRDFVAVGDVQIKVIGADGQILDAQTPVRLLMEQLVAGTGLPPFLLGLSWSATERMAAQQADLLTSELWSIRRGLESVLDQICGLWLRLHGLEAEVEYLWEDISLQDTVEESRAALYRAQAEKLRR